MERLLLKSMLPTHLTDQKTEEEGTSVPYPVSEENQPGKPEHMPEAEGCSPIPGLDTKDQKELGAATVGGGMGWECCADLPGLDGKLPR